MNKGDKNNDIDNGLVAPKEIQLQNLTGGVCPSERIRSTFGTDGDHPDLRIHYPLRQRNVCTSV